MNFELVTKIACRLQAISNFAYDIHYNARGKDFYENHLFAERMGDQYATASFKDEIFETVFLGRGQEVPSSKDIEAGVLALTPESVENEEQDYKTLRGMISACLVDIESLDGLSLGEGDLFGRIASILQRHNGLLFARLTYKENEVVNNSADEDEAWRFLVSNDKWITVNPSGIKGKGHPLLIKDGETVEEAIERTYKQKELFGKKGFDKSPDFAKKQEKAKLEEKIEKEAKRGIDGNIRKQSELEEKYSKLFGDEELDKFQEKILKEIEEEKEDKERKEKYRQYLHETLEKGAKKVYDTAHKYEKNITKDIVEEAKKQGVTNIGIDFRKKSIDRAVEKAREDIKEKGYENLSEAFDKMYDLVRYTQAGNVDNLVETASKTLENLKEKGYQIHKIKNFFLDEKNPYSGVNVQMVSPQGVKMELQFNTPKNAVIKEKMHKIYERQRKPNVSEEDKKKYEKQMWKLAPRYEVPKNIEKLQ